MIGLPAPGPGVIARTSATPRLVPFCVDRLNSPKGR